MDEQKLITEVEFELAEMRETVRLAAQMAALTEEQRDPWDAMAAAKLIADVIMGLENLSKRRRKHLGLPDMVGPESHRDLLNDFLAEPDLGGVMHAEARERLWKYLRFRHRFAHAYGERLEWKKVEEPLRLLPDTVKVLEDVWTKWLAGRKGGER